MMKNDETPDADAISVAKCRATVATGPLTARGCKNAATVGGLCATHDAQQLRDGARRAARIAESQRRRGVVADG